MEGFESIVGVDFWTALFTCVNMVITFLLLKKFLFKPVKKMIDDRQKEIDDLYAGADKANAEAERLREDYQRHLDAAKAERDEILRDAVTHAQKREAEIISEAKADAVAIRMKAERDIAQEKKKAINEIKNDISGMAMDIASKVVEREINEDDHTRLVEDFIGKIGESDD